MGGEPEVRRAALGLEEAFLGARYADALAILAASDVSKATRALWTARLGACDEVPLPTYLSALRQVLAAAANGTVRPLEVALLVTDAARQLQRVGAPRLAHALIKEAARGLSDGAAREVVEGASGQALGHSLARTTTAAAVIELLARDHHVDAERVLHEIVARPTSLALEDYMLPAQVLWAHRTLAQLYRGKGDFGTAAKLEFDAAQRFPHARDVALTRLRAAADAVMGGSHHSALTHLETYLAQTDFERGSTEDTSHPDFALRLLDAFCVALRSDTRRENDESLEVCTTQQVVTTSLEPDQTTSHSSEAATAKLLLRALERDDHVDPGVTSVVRLRRLLEERSCAVLRLRLSPRTIELAVRSGAIVVLEQTRGDEVRLVVVQAVIPALDLVLVRDATAFGPEPRTWDQLDAQAREVGWAGLVVFSRKLDGASIRTELARRGLRHDESFDAVDLGDLDPAGASVPHMGALSLVEEAIQIAPDLPQPWKRWGELLLDQRRVGAFPKEAIEKWVLGTAERFIMHAWPAMIRARALALQRRLHESAMAWADAVRFNPQSAEAWLGFGRAALEVSLADTALDAARRCVLLEPGRAEGYALWARVLLREGHPQEARELLDFALELAPSNPSVLIPLARAYELQGELDLATTSLRDAVEADPRNLKARQRLLHRCYHDGEWDMAKVHVERCLAMHSDQLDVHVDAVRYHWATANAYEAMEAALHAVTHFPTAPALIDIAVRAATHLYNEFSFGDQLPRLLFSLEDYPTARVDVAASLAHNKLHEAAMPVLRDAVRELGDDPSGAWRAAQIILSHPGLRGAYADEAGVYLDRVISQTGSYLLPRVTAALLCGPLDDAAGEWLRGAAPEANPLLHAVTTAFIEGHMLHEAPDVALLKDAIPERLIEVLIESHPSVLVDAVRFLTSIGFDVPAHRLLEIATYLELWHPDLVAQGVEVALRSDRPAVALRWLSERDPNPSVETLPLWLRVHEAREDWQACEDVAGRLWKMSIATSGSRFAESWGARGQWVALRARRGEMRGIEVLRKEAPRHPLAWFEVARLARLLDLDDRRRFEADLLSLAPGLARQLLGERLRASEVPGYLDDGQTTDLIPSLEDASSLSTLAGASRDAADTDRPDFVMGAETIVDESQSPSLDDPSLDAFRASLRASLEKEGKASRGLGDERPTLQPEPETTATLRKLARFDMDVNGNATIEVTPDDDGGEE